MSRCFDGCLLTLSPIHPFTYSPIHLLTYSPLMNPETTHIVIRKRNAGEILNLAFLLTARWLPQMLWAGILMVPFCLLPWGLYYATSVMHPEWLAALYEEFGEGEMFFLYAGGMLVFAFLMESLLTAPITLLMGQLFFGGEADKIRILGKAVAFVGMLR